MCTSPISILNPNYGLGHIGLNRFKNTVDKYIQVPCGTCYECLSSKQTYFSQPILIELISRDLYYGMLSIRDDMFEYTDVLDYHLKILPFKTLQLALRRMRKDERYKDLRYLCVAEYGGKTHRPHFHFVFSLPREKDLYKRALIANNLFHDTLKYWCRNVGSHRNPIYKPMLTYHKGRDGRFNYHCDFVNYNQCKKFALTFYYSKYLFKPDEYIQKLRTKIKLDERLTEDERKYLLRSITPKFVKSPKFGAIETDEQRDHIRNCISLSNSNKYVAMPWQFIDPFDGSVSPMKPSLRQRVVSVDDMQYKYDHVPHEENSFSFLIRPDLSDSINVVAKHSYDIRKKNRIKNLLFEKY